MSGKVAFTRGRGIKSNPLGAIIYTRSSGINCLASLQDKANSYGKHYTKKTELNRLPPKESAPESSSLQCSTLTFLFAILKNPYFLFFNLCKNEVDVAKWSLLPLTGG